MDDVAIFLSLLALGYFCGLYFEKKHYQSLKERERQTHHLPMVTFGAKQTIPEAREAALFIGSVVIAADYFKTFASSLKNLFGGRMVLYEGLLERGRREAVLRMKEQAIAWGATQVVNVRMETSNIGTNKNGIEVIVYGTGIR
ncbi:MAG: YbjQ family protein [Symploca sp. SIO2E9]|nr:YbjQ family protein [Symploca sp. SIO2E9]